MLEGFTRQNFQYYFTLNDGKAHLTEFAFWWVNIFHPSCPNFGHLDIVQISGFTDRCKF